MHGPEWTRLAWFGTDPTDTGAWTGIESAVDTFVWDQMREFDSVLREPDLAMSAGDGNDLNQDVLSMGSSWAEYLRPISVQLANGHSLGSGNRADSLRVLLMGRTMAGKSTVLEALSGGDGSRRGDGRQRFTRDICMRPITDLPGVVLVDTPGVGAKDGAEDLKLAFGEVPGADLILWVAANDSTQEETAIALRMLGFLGKPVIVALNCRMDLDHRGRYLDFLEEPDLTFAASSEHLAVIDRHLATSGATAVTAVVIHADAAFRSAQLGPDQGRLHENSRVDSLLEAIRTQLNGLAEQRRALRVFDSVRTPAMEGLTALDIACAGLRSQIEVERGRVTDLCGRLNHVVDTRSEALQVEVRQLIDARQGWHLTVDPAGDLAALWAAEAETMTRDFGELMKRESVELSRGLNDACQEVVSDWRDLPTDKLKLDDIPGFDSVWANRGAKAGLGLGISLGTLAAGAALGAKIGAWAGVEGGPPLMAITAVVGAAIGGIASIAAKPIKDLINRLFRSKGQVLKNRREEVARQLRPMLQLAGDEAVSAAVEMTDAYRRAVAKAIESRRAALQGQESILQGWTQHRGRIRTHVSELDSATATGLLRMANRDRCSRAVVRAERSPGVAIAIELSEPAFTELALFPPAHVAERLLPAPRTLPTCPAGVALHLLIGLASGRVGVTQLRPETAELQLLDDRPPEGVLSAWADLLSTFARSDIQITCSEANTKAIKLEGPT